MARLSSMISRCQLDYLPTIAAIISSLLICAVGAKGANVPLNNAASLFESRIRPILAEHCVECHGAKKQKGNLRLDSPQGIRAGGGNGPILTPGSPGSSRLIHAIRHEDEDLRMPPERKLSDRQVEALTEWIAAGAPMPETEPPEAPQAASKDFSMPRLRSGAFRITAKDRAHWAFQPLRRPAIPEPNQRRLGSYSNPIDKFLARSLEDIGIRQNPSARRRDLIRRAYFDLIGLPPTPELVSDFECSNRTASWEQLIDSLLASPRFGERWARHWLDLVRFGETNGYERDGNKPYAWRYRDYVIDALNSDLPYDRFVLGQLAGDLIEPFSAPALVATGFYRLHVWDDEPDSTLAAEFDDLDDVLSTTSSAFLGLTLGCARCHDHKYEPFSQEDYYSALAHIRNIEPYGLHHKGGGGRGTGSIVRPLAPKAAAEKWESDRAFRLSQARALLMAAKSPEERSQAESGVRAIEHEIPSMGLGLIISDRTGAFLPAHVLTRGNPEAPAEEVKAKPPALFLPHDQPVLSTAETPFNPRDDRPKHPRLQLAQWIASARNPLTARVMANRVWKHLFGTGLHRTPNDFGIATPTPVNPQLLDFLAIELIENGWRIKPFIRLIMTSAAYQQSANISDSAGTDRDPENHRFWRQSVRRLEAEAIRDTFLAISGSMNLAMGGPGVYSMLPAEVHSTQDSSGKGWGTSSSADQSRRSIYLFMKRALPLPFLEAFDQPLGSASAGERPVTTVAPQALTLLNDGFSRTQAAGFARRLEREVPVGGRAQVERAFALALQRLPEEFEAAASLALLESQGQLCHEKGSPWVQSKHQALESFCLALLNLSEVLYID